MDKASKWKKIIITANILSVIAIISIILLHYFDQTTTIRQEPAEEKIKHVEEAPKKAEIQSVRKLDIDDFKFLMKENLPSDTMTLAEQEEKEVIVDYDEHNGEEESEVESSWEPETSQQETHTPSINQESVDQKEGTTEKDNNQTDKKDKKDEKDETDQTDTNDSVTESDDNNKNTGTSNDEQGTETGSDVGGDDPIDEGNSGEDLDTKPNESGTDPDSNQVLENRLETNNEN